jgi:hypothetical protein
VLPLNARQGHRSAVSLARANIPLNCARRGLAHPCEAYRDLAREYLRRAAPELLVRRWAYAPTTGQRASRVSTGVRTNPSTRALN